MDNERGYKCENWLVQRVHSYELTSSTNELLHFVIEPWAFLMTLLFTDLACEHFSCFLMSPWLTTETLNWITRLWSLCIKVAKGLLLLELQHVVRNMEHRELLVLVDGFEMCKSLIGRILYRFIRNFLLGCCWHALFHAVWLWLGGYSTCWLHIRTLSHCLLARVWGSTWVN